jgi:hypothetical protein
MANSQVKFKLKLCDTWTWCLCIDFNYLTAKPQSNLIQNVIYFSPLSLTHFVRSVKIFGLCQGGLEANKNICFCVTTLVGTGSETILTYII